jgi:hypothetical protein
MPQYLMLIYNPVESPLSPAEQAAMMPRWNEFTQSLKDAGLLVAGDALQGIDVATTVRVRDGQTQITDGPFAETKEFLAGYYQLDAADLDTVLAHADRVPNVSYGSIEIRPILDLSARESAAAEAQSAAQV